jgi:hypothetical protein
MMEAERVSENLYVFFYKKGWWEKSDILAKERNCRKQNYKHKMYVIALILQRVSTSYGDLQASSIQYIKGIVYDCVQGLCTIVHNSF